MSGLGNIVSTTVDDELKEWLQSAAAADGIYISMLVRNILKKEMLINRSRDKSNNQIEFSEEEAD